MPKNKMLKPKKYRIESTLSVLFNSVCQSIIALYGFNGFSRQVRNVIESYNSNLFRNES